MPDVNINKNLILTDYGRNKILSNVSEKDFDGYNLSYICLGNKLNKGYNNTIDTMGNIVNKIMLNPEDIEIKDKTCSISFEVDSTSDIYEIGLYDSDDNLFAYISNICIKKMNTFFNFFFNNFQFCL